MKSGTNWIVNKKGHVMTLNEKEVAGTSESKQLSANLIDY